MKRLFMVIERMVGLMDLYYAKQITQEEMVEKLRESVSLDDFNIAISTLPSSGSREVVGDVLLAGFWMAYYNENNEAPLRELLGKNFHDSHEDIVSLFQLRWNRKVENIHSLLQALESIPDYLSPDDFRYPYISNLIYAIGAQPQPESLNALEALLSETNDDVIRAMLSRQIEERRSLVGGRYEFEERGE